MLQLSTKKVKKVVQMFYHYPNLHLKLHKSTKFQKKKSKTDILGLNTLYTQKEKALRLLPLSVLLFKIGQVVLQVLDLSL